MFPLLASLPKDALRLVFELSQSKDRWSLAVTCTDFLHEVFEELANKELDRIEQEHQVPPKWREELCSRADAEAGSRLPESSAEVRVCKRQKAGCPASKSAKMLFLAERCPLYQLGVGQSASGFGCASLRCSQEGSYLWTTGMDGCTIVQWDLKSQSPVQKIKIADTENPYAGSLKLLHVDSRHVVAVEQLQLLCRPGTIRVWEVNGAPQFQFSASWLRAAAVWKDEVVLVRFVVGFDGRTSSVLEAADLQSGTYHQYVPGATWYTDDRFQQVTIHPVGDWLLVATAAHCEEGVNGAIHVLPHMARFDTDPPHWVVPGNAWAITISPCSRLVAAALDDCISLLSFQKGVLQRTVTIPLQGYKYEEFCCGYERLLLLDCKLYIARGKKAHNQIGAVEVWDHIDQQHERTIEYAGEGMDELQALATDGTELFCAFSYFPANDGFTGNEEKDTWGSIKAFLL